MQAVSELEICQSELEVYHAGELTVLGFGGREILYDFNMTEFREEILELVQRHHCQALALDLTNVRTIPVGLPGILTDLIHRRLEIHLYNASDDIRTMLSFANLDRFLHLHDIEIDF